MFIMLELVIVAIRSSSPGIQQWFVKMKPLAQPAIEVVKNGTTQFVPERFSKTYYNWMENIQDWHITSIGGVTESLLGIAGLWPYAGIQNRAWCL